MKNKLLKCTFLSIFLILSSFNSLFASIEYEVCEYDEKMDNPRYFGEPEPNCHCVIVEDDSDDLGHYYDLDDWDDYDNNDDDLFIELTCGLHTVAQNLTTKLYLSATANSTPKVNPNDLMRVNLRSTTSTGLSCSKTWSISGPASIIEKTNDYIDFKVLDIPGTIIVKVTAMGDCGLDCPQSSNLYELFTVNYNVQCPIKLRSETVAISPSNRDRRTIGIGEKVEIYLSGLCDGAKVQWEFINDSKIQSELKTSGDDYFRVLNAGYEPGQVIVKVKFTELKEDCKKCPSEIPLLFTIIAPNKVVGKQIEHCPEPKNYQYLPDGGFNFQKYLQPYSVNFGNIYIRESPDGETNSFDTDYYNGHPDPEKHSEINPNFNFLKVSSKGLMCEVVPGLGTQTDIIDKVYMKLLCPEDRDPKNSGYHEWGIPEEYSYLDKNGNLAKGVQYYIQIQRIDNIPQADNVNKWNNSKCKVSKDGINVMKLRRVPSDCGSIEVGCLNEN